LRAEPQGRFGLKRENDPKLAVCLVTDSEEPSGVGEHMLGLASALRVSTAVSFVCPPSSAGLAFIERARRSGLDTLALHWTEPRATERFRAWLRSREIDICHVHAGIGWEGLDIVETARAHVPVVVRTEHLPFLLTDQSERARYAEMLRRVDGVICVSKQVRESFLNARVPASLTTVVRNGVAVHRTPRDRERIRASLHLGADNPMILTVARFTEQKDYRTLLESLPSIIAGEPSARFLWVGTGPLEHPMRREISERGLDRHVLFLGHRHDVPDLMAAADLFTLPSRFEGLPLAVLEAMSAGRAIVATRVSGTVEAVQNRVTGLLVEPGNPALLAGAILEVLANPEWRAELGARGRARAQRAFGLPRMAREVLAVYHGLLRRSGRPRNAELNGHPDLSEPVGANL
jgi:glycosyltransferase involved in cell wall biosynthesis